MDMLHKNRELMAWVALGAVALVMLSAFVDIAAINDSWPTDSGPELSTVARLIDHKFAPILALLVAALATWFAAYWREPTRKASLIALVGLCLAGAGALLHLVFTLIGWGGNDSNGLFVFSSLLELLANLAGLGLLAAFFYVTWKHVAPLQLPAAPGQQPGQSQLGQHGQSQQAGAPVQQPTWQPSEASGGAWNRAGDAATGAGANTWGVPGQQAQGWQPSATPQPSAAEPQWGQQAPRPEWGQQPAPQQDWNQQPAPQPSAAQQDWNQPGQGQPGHNQPGQGQPGHNQPGQNQPGQNQWGPSTSSWAPAAQPQVSGPGEADGDEGTVLRPHPNQQSQPNQQWRPEDNSQR